MTDTTQPGLRDILNDLIKVASGIVVAPGYTIDTAEQAILSLITAAKPEKRMIEQFPETITTDWIEENPHMSTDLGFRNGFNKGIATYEARLLAKLKEGR